MKKFALLLVLLLSIVGCTQVIVKDGNPVDEKQKAVSWIKMNNIWGSERKADNIVGVVEKYIDEAVAAGASKNSDAKPFRNIYIAISSKAVKSGKNTMIVWKNSTFSVRELTDKETTDLKVPEFGLTTGYL